MGNLIVYDYGTTALKAVVFDPSLHILAETTREMTYHYFGEGSIEMDANYLWTLTSELTAEIGQKCSLREIAHISITSNAETLAAVKSDGRCARSILVWMDERAKKQNEALKEKISLANFYNSTGLTEFSAIWPVNKMAWIKEEEPGIFKNVWKFMLLKDYILFKLTGESVSDPSISSYSGCFNVNTKSWDKKILDLAEIEESKLPQIKNPSAYIGKLTTQAAEDLGLGENTRVYNGMLDQCASIIGAGGLKDGQVTETTGTVLAVASTLESISEVQKAMLLPYICHGVPDKYLALIYSPTAGILLKWYKDNFYLGINSKTSYTDSEIYQMISKEVGEAELLSQLIFLPHFCGSMYPKANPSAKGAIAGLTLNTKRADIAKAIFESIAFLLKENVLYFNQRNIQVQSLMSLGGAAKSEVWLQTKADVLGMPVTALRNKESTAFGCGFCAALEAGYFSNHNQMDELIRERTIYQPTDSLKEYYDKKFDLYLRFNEATDKLFE